MTKDRLIWIIKSINFDSLTLWEETFLESVEKQFYKFGDISEKQEEILERIYRERD